jgi:hypothetical protein
MDGTSPRGSRLGTTTRLGVAVLLKLPKLLLDSINCFYKGLDSLVQDRLGSRSKRLHSLVQDKLGRGSRSILNLLD